MCDVSTVHHAKFHRNVTQSFDGSCSIFSQDLIPKGQAMMGCSTNIAALTADFKQIKWVFVYAFHFFYVTLHFVIWSRSKLNGRIK